MLKNVVLTFSLFLAYSSAEEPLVETTLGPIRGHHKLSYENRTFSAFEGIPYAKPPVGALRFKEPQPPKPWLGTWDATLVHECMQLSWFTNAPAGSEDCLYLNVYVPKPKPTPNDNLDVVVHIHGGGFMAGSADMAGPQFLMDRNIVYVNLNYRLGVLGFLSTEDHVVPGNNGLKDQTLALKWVQKHIRNFGGNPDSVTIIGLSAGGSSVHFHYFSRLSKGLFHRGISESGTALAPWALTEAPLDLTKQLAESIGCDNSSTETMIECMRQRPGNEVVKNSYKFSPYDRLPIAPFAPVVEKQSDTAFLTDYPYKLLEAGNVTDLPWLSSATTEEGALALFSIKNKWTDLNDHWDDLLPYFLDYNHTVADSDKPKVADEIKKFYFGDADITEDNVQSIIKLFGDRYFMLDMEKSVRMQAKVSKSPIYTYIYGYESQVQLNFSSMLGLTKSYGVGHGYDSFLLYSMKMGGLSFTVDKLSDSDETIKEVLLDVVTSFAKNGKPDLKDVEWGSTSNSDDFRYLFIHEPNDVKMASKKELAPADFWRSLPIRENENLISTTKNEL